ncbi:response regulator transcription factor [Silvanigrella sp.]|jgi:two-component system copper resistance phosphate regulon response regulator CusR|uniref:response regulator transcription factor n=1 Tax=Silvanigrella sp. TaxID=2024976 RepID=UPI0037CB5565
MKILLIEDSIKTSKFLKNGLTENGFVVDSETDGQEGLTLAQINNYDLIILDVMLPSMDSWTILKKLRMNDNKSYIIMLTARNHVDYIVKGLSLGADDYIVKPFSFSELLARIKSILRRRPSILKDIFICHDLKIDFNKNEIFRGSERINLTPKEFTLLNFLIQNENSPVSRSVMIFPQFYRHN